jgi:hypothetical protein
MATGSLRRNATILAMSVLLGSGTIAIAACTAPESTTETAPDAEIVTLYVGPEKVDCVGVAPQECLLVRDSPDEEYEFFYSQINGFDYEPGYEYELLVQKTPVENPPADASSIAWTLVEVVSQTPVNPEF